MERQVSAEEAYGVLSKVFNDPKMASGLTELDTNAAAREQAKKDAHGYLTAHGISLPKDVTAAFTTTNSWRLKICLFRCCITFESR